MTKSQLHRAMAPEDKTERRGAIVRAAEELLLRSPAGAFSVEMLSRRAGLAKGTVYLYFRTREEVLLAVHHARLQRLFDVLEHTLAAPDADARSAARATLRFLRANREFLPLATTCRGMLEANVGTEAALDFKLATGQRLAQIGARIEALYPKALSPGEGFALLMDSYALIIGLWQIVDPPACLRGAMRRPEMRMFQIDYERQLERALLALWDGATGRRGGQP
ncbi:MAG: TetR family transcriptional regulator [Betaproteobacteria bacterium]|nr:TetR family transcriptional regulator [Betaproteobacteria bacterium]